MSRPHKLIIVTFEHGKRVERYGRTCWCDRNGNHLPKGGDENDQKDEV